MDFRDFPGEIDRQTEPGLAIRLICDNLSAHKAPVVHKWLLAHPASSSTSRPTYSSWISQVERWFAELQRRCLDRGVYCSLDELTTALEDWIKTWNANARPFKRARTADQIIDRICRYSSHLRTGTLAARPRARCQPPRCQRDSVLAGPETGNSAGKTSGTTSWSVVRSSRIMGSGCS